MRASFDGRRLHVDEEAAMFIRGLFHRSDSFEIAMQALLGFRQASALQDVVKNFLPSTPQRTFSEGVTWLRGIEVVQDLTEASA